MRRELRFSPSKGFSEIELITRYLKYFNECQIMVDVGAHYGESFAAFERAGWKIFAFEPDPQNRRKIECKSVSTEVYEEAVSDHDGQELTLYTSQESTGISSLTPFHLSHEASVKVNTVTLSTFCRKRKIESVDFLKIDTEGFDLFVLKGFPFEKILPRIILCEFEDKKTLPIGYTYKEMGDFLVDKGYRVFISEWHPIVKYGIDHSWRSLQDFPKFSLKDRNGWGNFIAVRSDCQSDFVRVKDTYLKSVGIK